MCAVLVKLHDGQLLIFVASWTTYWLLFMWVHNTHGFCNLHPLITKHHLIFKAEDWTKTQLMQQCMQIKSTLTKKKKPSLYRKLTGSRFIFLNNTTDSGTLPWPDSREEQGMPTCMTFVSKVPLPQPHWTFLEHLKWKKKKCRVTVDPLVCSNRVLN